MLSSLIICISPLCIRLRITYPIHVYVYVHVYMYVYMYMMLYMCISMRTKDRSADVLLADEEGPTEHGGQRIAK